MNFIWDSSLESQTQNLLIQYVDLVSGFFGRIHAIILPYFVHKYWNLPDLNLFSDSKFKEEIEKVDPTQSYFISENNYCYKKVFEKFQTAKLENAEFILDFGDLDLKNQKDQFTKFEKQIRKYLELTFGTELLSKIRNIYILPTKFGTYGSFGFSKPDKKSAVVDVYANYRIDVFDHLPRNIFAAILSLHEKYSTQHNYHTWRDRQAIMDFIGTETEFGKLFTNLPSFGHLPKRKDTSSNNSSKLSTLEMLEFEHGEYAIDSAKYFSKLGYPVKSNFEFDQVNIYHDSIPLIELTKQQSSFLKLLISNHGKIVDFDTLAQALWKDEWRERFSFDAMSKLLEKLRRTLERNQVSPSVILTVRKQGYVLWG